VSLVEGVHLHGVEASGGDLLSVGDHLARAARLDAHRTNRDLFGQHLARDFEHPAPLGGRSHVALATAGAAHVHADARRHEAAQMCAETLLVERPVCREGR